MNIKHTAMLLLALLSSANALAQDGATPQSPPPSDDAVLEVLRRSLPFDVHGGLWLWHYEPFLDGVENKTEIYYAYLTLDAKYGKFGFHVEPRFRSSKLRPFFTSNTWLQEAYLSWKPDDQGTGILKAGKVYSQFGRAWDGVFYGNIPYFDGLKLDPDMGLSWEQNLKAGGEVAVDYSLQFFSQDGETNGSLQGRDTLSIGRQRNSVVGRVAPTFKLGQDTDLTVGASAMHFSADLPSPASDSSVSRLGGDVSLRTGPFTVFGDFAHQNGNHVIDFPLPGSASSDIDYLMSGVSYQTGDWTFRYSYSFGDYHDDDVKEELHLPGVQYQINKHMGVWLEYVYWQREDAGDHQIIDRSLNLTLNAGF